MSSHYQELHWREGKSSPKTTTRFSPNEESKYIRRMRRKYQALNYLQRAYELGV